mmetsp:Transcript_45664/g.109929  ORF Transcript_45664/g.109929 Transcript_45664/m.109929 type:complete len:366 (-) Transcript_45664:1039-2136(-)
MVDDKDVCESFCIAVGELKWFVKLLDGNCDIVPRHLVDALGSIIEEPVRQDPLPDVRTARNHQSVKDQGALAARDTVVVLEDGVELLKAVVLHRAKDCAHGARVEVVGSLLLLAVVQKRLVVGVACDLARDGGKLFAEILPPWGVNVGDGATVQDLEDEHLGLASALHSSAHHFLQHLVTVVDVLVQERAVDPEEVLAYLGEEHRVAVDKVEVDPQTVADSLPNPPVHPLHCSGVVCKPPSLLVCLGGLYVRDPDAGSSLRLLKKCVDLLQSILPLSCVEYVLFEVVRQVESSIPIEQLCHEVHAKGGSEVCLPPHCVGNGANEASLPPCWCSRWSRWWKESKVAIVCKQSIRRIFFSENLQIGG